MKVKKYNRIFTIVIDSLGEGALEDAADYGDACTDTLGHISQSVQEFAIPNLQKLGIANLHPLKQTAPVKRPLGYYMKLREASVGKDTMTVHWEMMGLHITTPFRTFTEKGFPPELLEELSARTGRTIIGNKSASGTEILEELGRLTEAPLPALPAAERERLRQAAARLGRELAERWEACPHAARLWMG